jgi:hypothetical protein
LIYENINPARFQAELVGREKAPEYKQDGFFIFSDLREGAYTLKITGQRLQPRISNVVIPAKIPVFLDSRGDNELIVIVREIEDFVGNNGGKKITFDTVILTKEIRAGARVISNTLPEDSSARLASGLDAGRVFSARVENGNGLAVGSIVRIIRDRSLLMKFDPYHLFASPTTRVVGKVVSQQNPAIPLPGAQVRLTGINDTAITSDDTHGVMIFQGVDTSGKTIVLGAEKDISVVTNERGDYNLYFSNETLASFKITDTTLDELESANVPEDVRNKLEPLKEKIFRGQERFLLALREAIGNENTIKYQPLILQHSENFIQNLTIEVTLAGFEPASKLEPISTGQRKVVNFQLVKV